MPTFTALDNFKTAQQEIFDYFGYVENWRAIPIDDRRKMYWQLSGEGSGDFVKFHEEKDVVLDIGGDYYEDEVYTQRFLSKWVYRGTDFTLICVDTNVDGNKFLAIYDNEKELPIPF